LFCQRRSAVFLAFVVLILSAPVVTGKPLEDRAWIAVQTENFLLHSVLSKRKTVALAPDDPYTQLDAAEYWHDRARQSPDEGVNLEYLDRARSHYLKAWQLDDSIPEVYAMYGQTFLDEGQNHTRAIEMLETAIELLPSNLDIRVMLAQAFAGAGREQEAIKEARSVLAWSHAGGHAGEQAEELLSELELELEPEE